MSYIRYSIAALTLLCVLAQTSHAADEIKRVLIVHSYEEGQICGQPQHDGVVEGLVAAGYTPGKNVSLATYYMDTKRTFGSPEQIVERGRLALEAVNAFMPDVVVVLDDNAIRTVMLPLVGSKCPVVFSGMNGQPETYDKMKHFMDSWEKPGANVTGVYEKLHFVTSVNVMKAVLPEVKKILILTDVSPSGEAIRIQLKKELAEQPTDVSCEILTIKSFEEFKKIILERVNVDPEVSAIATIVMRADGPDGQTYTSQETFRWQIEHCTKPSMALNYFFSKQGLFGGAAVDFKAMGRQAGEKVARILSGTPAGSLPIEDARKYAIVFNTARARALGIEIPFEILGAADFVYDKIELKDEPGSPGSCDAGVQAKPDAKTEK